MDIGYWRHWKLVYENYDGTMSPEKAGVDSYDY